MSALNEVAGIKALTKLDSLIQSMPENTGSPLDAEGKIYIYEATALYYLKHRNDPKLAQRFLYWEEAIAHEHGLQHRLSVIAALLDKVDSTKTSGRPIHSIVSTDTSSNDSLIRERFRDILATTNLEKANLLVNEQLISSKEYSLVEGLALYRQALESIDETGLFSKAARLLSPQLPEHPESCFFWALLMLQLHSKVGSFDNNSDSRFILEVLNNAIDTIQPDEKLLKFVAKLFPLGLSIAAHLSNKLSGALDHVAIILHDDKRDGIRIADVKLANLPPPVREAIIIDGIHADNTEFQAIISSKTGHTMNKKRFDQALKKALLQPHELTDIGSIFRGINQLAKSGHKDAESALQSVLSDKPYLKDLVES